MLIITSKFTTPEMIVPLGAMRSTRPANSRAGKDSTVNDTGLPSATLPMSVSSTRAMSSSAPSSMIVAKVGVLKLAAMVSPSWVVTEATVPVIGERMTA